MMRIPPVCDNAERFNNTLNGSISTEETCI
jgi:hypothetical protein